MVSALRAAKSAILTTHITPDADGFGAALALLRVLRRRGCAAEFINCSASPQNLRFLTRRGEFKVFEATQHWDRVQQADVIVATDLGGARRLGRMLECIQGSTATKLLIDHHRYQNDLFDHALIVESASSSCEITRDLLRLMECDLDVSLAEPLYAGLVTDTGSFAYEATTPRVHRLAAELLECGVEPAKVWRELHCAQPLSRLQALGASLSGITLTCAGKVATSIADKALLERLAVVPRDAFEIVNYLLRIRGVEAGVFFFPVDAQRTKVSLRSAGRLDVCAIAERHGGGGHRFASGCTVEGMDCDSAVRVILDALETQLAMSNEDMEGNEE